MIQVPAGATVANVQDTVPRTVESRCLPPQTRVASIVQAVPQLLDPEKEVLPTEAVDGSCCSLLTRGSYFLLFLLFSRYRCLSQTTVGAAYRLE